MLILIPNFAMYNLRFRSVESSTTKSVQKQFLYLFFFALAYDYSRYCNMYICLRVSGSFTSMYACVCVYGCFDNLTFLFVCLPSSL